MIKINTVNILDYELYSAQGDKKQTLFSVKNKDVDVSFKRINSIDGEMKFPYFTYKNNVKDTKDEITQLIKKVVMSLSSKLTKEEKGNTALLIGTALIDKNIIDSVEDESDSYNTNPELFSKCSIDSYAQDIANDLGLNSFTMTVCTACTSSANALLEAKNLINAGVVTYAIVVGVEVFSKVLSGGFSAMNLLSLSTQKPFDKQRDGLILGEGIAGILLGEDRSSWSLLGGYTNCNSETITSVSQSGKEMQEVMQNAMQNVSLSSKDFRALKVHGTSSISNDISEYNAISNLFTRELLFTAVKPYIGHTLGACGVLELALFMTCIDDGFIPATLDCIEPISKDYVPISEHTLCEEGIFMMNYFGFAGNNTSLVIKKELL